MSVLEKPKVLISKYVTYSDFLFEERATIIDTIIALDLNEETAKAEMILFTIDLLHALQSDYEEAKGQLSARFLEFLTYKC